jgi:ADP-ribose pyrophosphatase YjhB (NUDIX family)
MLFWPAKVVPSDPFRYRLAGRKRFRVMHFPSSSGHRPAIGRRSLGIGLLHRDGYLLRGYEAGVERVAAAEQPRIQSGGTPIGRLLSSWFGGWANLCRGSKVASMKKRVPTFAYVIFRAPQESSEILVVKRSPNDRYFPSMWGIPAGTLRKHEGYEEAIRRTASHRLGIEVEVLGERGVGSSDRGTHAVEMRLFEARIVTGSPQVREVDPNGHGYVEVRWAEPDILKPTRERGSLCCQLVAEWLSMTLAESVRHDAQRFLEYHEELPEQATPSDRPRD